MSEERIVTMHPQGKDGVNILKRRYDTIKEFIVNTIEKHDVISYERLSELASSELGNSFDGKVTWYIVTVKLDLEARKLIERVPRTSPHELRMKN